METDISNSLKALGKTPLPRLVQFGAVLWFFLILGCAKKQEPAGGAAEKSNKEESRVHHGTNREASIKLDDERNACRRAVDDSSSGNKSARSKISWSGPFGRSASAGPGAFIPADAKSITFGAWSVGYGIDRSSW